MIEDTHLSNSKFARADKFSKSGKKGGAYGELGLPPRIKACRSEKGLTGFHRLLAPLQRTLLDGCEFPGRERMFAKREGAEGGRFVRVVCSSIS